MDLRNAAEKSVVFRDAVAKLVIAIYMNILLATTILCDTLLRRLQNFQPYRLDLTTLSNTDLVRLCERPDCQLVGGSIGGRRFVKLSPGVIVKYGWSVTPEEAANQEFAHSCRSDLRIPEVYRYFRVSDVGYLVMEFMDGISLEKIPLHHHPPSIQRLARAIHSLASKMASGPPGPRNGGIPRGYLFSEDGAGERFHSISGLNSWLNRRARLGKNELGFHFKMSDFSYCHLDLARRNMVLLPDQSFCLLDWEFAGFYPRVFEIYCLRFVGQGDYAFTQALLAAFDDIHGEAEDQTEKECQVTMLNRVYRNNLKYSL
jgi:Phosphotransferase enzyme family